MKWEDILVENRERIHFSIHFIHLCFLLLFYFASPFTSHIKVVFSKAEKHMKNFAFVADWWIFYFCHFSPKAKSIPCTHEIYTVVLVSCLPYSLTDVFFTNAINTKRKVQLFWKEERKGENGIEVTNTFLIDLVTKIYSPFSPLPLKKNAVYIP